jgi:hypothetical protein
MPTPRPRRTIIAGARATFAGNVAEVINISSTGALVRTEQQQRPGAESPFLLEADDVTPVPLTARVVRCEPVAGPLGTSRGKYMLALTFVDTAADTMTRLEQLCKTGRRADAAPHGLKVSLARRCPKCHSRDVAKESKRHYSCCQCGQVFTGYRIGFLRFSR